MAESRRSVLFNDPAAAAGLYTATQSIADQDALVVTWQVSGAGVAVGNLTLPEVRVVHNGLTLPTPLTPEVIHATTDTGSDVVAISRYDVRGLAGVEVRATTVGGPWDVTFYTTSLWS